MLEYRSCCLFFFNDTATTEIYTLSLHDALPICKVNFLDMILAYHAALGVLRQPVAHVGSAVNLKVIHFLFGLCRECKDRKSTRLNSSHANISYAVFCLKKKIIMPHVQFEYRIEL